MREVEEREKLAAASKIESGKAAAESKKGTEPSSKSSKASAKIVLGVAAGGDSAGEAERGAEISGDAEDVLAGDGSAPQKVCHASSDRFLLTFPLY